MYITDINRARSLINEIKLIFNNIKNNATFEEIKSLIIDDNIFSIRAINTRWAAFRSIKKRFFPDEKIDLTIFKFINSSRLSNQAKNFLIYYKTAKSDELIYDLSINLLFDKMKSNEPTINTNEILNFFVRNEKEHSEISKWSVNTKIRLARHYLSIMKDFQFLVGSRVKILKKPEIPLEIILYVIFYLKEKGIAPENILVHNDFKLFLLNYNELRNLINLIISENILGNKNVGSSIAELIENNNLEGIINDIT